MGENLFDRDDLSDLSVETRRCLRTTLTPLPALPKTILSLFMSSDYLGMDDILIGLDRKTKNGCDRTAIYRQLVRVMRHGYVEKHTSLRGKYRITKAGQQYLKTAEILNEEK